MSTLLFPRPLPSSSDVHTSLPRLTPTTVSSLLNLMMCEQFAIGRCRALPMTSTEALPDDSDEHGGGEGGDGSRTADPGREISATIGADNAGKYLVATQV